MEFYQNGDHPMRLMLMVTQVMMGAPRGVSWALSQPLNCVTRAYSQLNPGDCLWSCLDAGDVPGGTAQQDHPGIAEGLLIQLLGRCGFEAMASQAGCDHVPSGPSDRAPLLFQRAPHEPRWRLGHLGERDFDAFSVLFTTVFDQPMGLGLWRWKYAEGRGCNIAAWREGRLIAHYGGNLRQVLALGRPVLAVQVCDAMVDPRERAVMTKTGAMFQVTAAFLELYQGLAGIPLSFGFPNRRAMRLGERLGHYAEVGALRELRWSPLGLRPRLSHNLRYLDPQQASDRNAIDKLWVAMAGDLEAGVLGVRDWDYLRHRYMEHPVFNYELVLVRSRITSTPLGLLVLRKEADAVALMDLVAPLKNIPPLLVQARRLAALWGKSSLYGWMTRQHLCRFQTRDMQVRDIQVSIPTNIWVPQPFTPEQLHDRWWLTLGDTDFN